MPDEKAPDQPAPAAPPPQKPKKLTNEEKYGGSGGKFDPSAGKPGGRDRRGPGKGKGFIDPGKP